MAVYPPAGAHVDGGLAACPSPLAPRKRAISSTARRGEVLWRPISWLRSRRRLHEPILCRPSRELRAGTGEASVGSHERVHQTRAVVHGQVTRSIPFRDQPQGAMDLHATLLCVPCADALVDDGDSAVHLGPGEGGRFADIAVS